MVYITNYTLEGARASRRATYSLGDFVKINNSSEDYHMRIGQISSIPSSGDKYTVTIYNISDECSNSEKCFLTSTNFTPEDVDIEKADIKTKVDGGWEHELNDVVKLVNVVNKVYDYDGEEVSIPEGTLALIDRVGDDFLTEIEGGAATSGFTYSGHDVYEVSFFVKKNSNGVWEGESSNADPDNSVSIIVYGNQMQKVAESQQSQYSEISKRFQKQENVAARIQSNIVEQEEKLDKLKDSIAEKARTSLLNDSVDTGDDTTTAVTATSAAAVAEEENDTITVKINTKNAYNKLSNYSNGVEDPLISIEIDSLIPGDLIKKLKEEIHYKILKIGYILPVEEQVLSPDETGNQTIYNDNTTLDQNNIKMNNEIYLRIKSGYSLDTLTCPNGCNKGTLNYIDDKCYDYTYTYAEGSETHKYRYCRPKCVMDECSTKGCVQASDCKGCKLYKVKSYDETNEGVPLFYTRDLWAKNTKDGAKMSGALLFNFVNNVWSTICNKVPPPEEKPCKCCDGLSNKHIPCGEELKHHPSLGANNLFDEDLTGRPEISLANKAVQPFNNIPTTKEFDSNKILPYEAIWDVDIL